MFLYCSRYNIKLSLQMKKALNHGTFILLLIIQVTACQKKPVIVPPVKAAVCQIKQVIWRINTTYPIDTAKFTYNNFGNPVSALVSQSRTGNPHIWFRYDQYNRLTDYIGTYTFSDVPDPLNTPAVVEFEFWFRYVYADLNPSSMPVSDTFRSMGYYVDGQFLNVNGMYIDHLDYDSQNRIIKLNRIVSGVDRSETYSYDVNGNLILPNVMYDNQKNYRRTNKVWMLIDRNFSKNNPFNAITYNDAGFPTTFSAPTSRGFHDIFMNREMPMLRMDYSCSMVQSGQ